MGTQYKCFLKHRRAWVNYNLKYPKNQMLFIYFMTNKAHGNNLSVYLPPTSHTNINIFGQHFKLRKLTSIHRALQVVMFRHVYQQTDTPLYFLVN